MLFRSYGITKYSGKVQSRAIARTGKRLAWPLLPIKDADQGRSMVGRHAAGREQRNEMQTKQKEDTGGHGIAKKRLSSESEVTERSRHASSSTSSVVDARPGPSLNQSAQGLELGECSSAPDAHVTSPTRDCVVWGISAAQRTHKTFELAGKIGKRPVSVLLDSGSTEIGRAHV